MDLFLVLKKTLYDQIGANVDSRGPDDLSKLIKKTAVYLYDKSPDGFKKSEVVHLFNPRASGGGVLSVSKSKVKELLDYLETLK